MVTVSPGASVLLTSVPASGRGKQEYFSVLRNSRILRNSMTLTALARVTTHYSADDTIHNCQQHCSVKFDFTIFQFQHLQHLASSSLGNELIAVVCDWRIWKSRDSRLLLLAEPSRTGAGHDTVVAILDSDLSLTIIGGNFVWITWQKVVIEGKRSFHCPWCFLPLHNTTLSCDNCSAVTLI